MSDRGRNEVWDAMSDGARAAAFLLGAYWLYLQEGEPDLGFVDQALIYARVGRYARRATA